MTTFVVRPKGYKWDGKIHIEPTPEKELKRVARLLKKYLEKELKK